MTNIIDESQGGHHIKVHWTTHVSMPLTWPVPGVSRIKDSAGQARMFAHLLSCPKINVEPLSPPGAALQSIHSFVIVPCLNVST